MKKLILLTLLTAFLVGCKTTEQNHLPLEYIVIEVRDRPDTRVVHLDQNGNKKVTSPSVKKRVAETAESLSAEGWTLVELERSSVLRNRGEQLRSDGDIVTLIFTRPKTN